MARMSRQTAYGMESIESLIYVFRFPSPAERDTWVLCREGRKAVTTGNEFVKRALRQAKEKGLTGWTRLAV